MSDAGGALRVMTEWAVYAALRGASSIKVMGLELVPRAGPLIVAGNHVSNLDGLLLGVAIASARRPFYLGKKELFVGPLGWLLRRVGVIPLDRRGADHAALHAALAALEGGGALIIFPEGTRVKPGTTRPPKAGVSFLAAKTGAPVTPARIVGTERFPRTPSLEVRFGAPLPAPGPGRQAGVDFARTVMDAVYAL